MEWKSIEYSNGARSTIIWHGNNYNGNGIVFIKGILSGLIGFTNPKKIVKKSRKYDIENHSRN